MILLAIRNFFLSKTVGIHSLLVQTFELAAFRHLIELVGEQMNQGLLFAHYERYAFDASNKLFSGTGLDQNPFTVPTAEIRKLVDALPAYGTTGITD